MVGFKHTIWALLLMMVTGTAIAQNNTNSPYTRYGYGDLSDQSFGNSKAMGGIAFGLRDGAQINPLNPASYTAIDFGQWFGISQKFYRRRWFASNVRWCWCKST